MASFGNAIERQRVKGVCLTYSHGVALGSRSTKAHSWKILKKEGFIAAREMMIFPGEFSWVTCGALLLAPMDAEVNMIDKEH